MSEKQNLYPKKEESYFLLHSHTPREVLKSFQFKKGLHESTDMKSWISLTAGNVPLPPRAFLFQNFFFQLLKKPNTEALKCLNQIVEKLESLTHCALGGREHPLLLTIKGGFSGSIRNVGVCSQSFPGLVHSYGTSIACGLYVDFLESFSSIILGAPFLDFREKFGFSIDRAESSRAFANESKEQFLQKVKEYQIIVAQKIGRAFPEKPEQQLLLILLNKAQFNLKNGKEEVSIQVQLQKSTFGQSVSGVAYTRNPFSGARDLYGVYQYGPSNEKATLEPEQKLGKTDESLKTKFPSLFKEVSSHLSKIEAGFQYVVEADFVSDEDGEITFVGFNKAEITARASVLSALEFNRNGTISDKETIFRIKASDVELLLHPSLEPSSKARLVDLGSTGSVAAPGTAVGHVFYKMQDAIDFCQDSNRHKADKGVILITDELLISDTPGLGIIQGLVTKAGGISSHAAVMARANGIPCLVGYRGLDINIQENTCKVNERVIKAGTLVTLEASSEGKLYLGEGKLENVSFQEGMVSDLTQIVTRLLKSERVPVEVRVNINNAKDAEVGLGFGASGVGLCRTENMFMVEEAIREIRNIIFSGNKEKCAESFQKLEELQFNDFEKIFETMKNRVVNIRLMDLPLHDFAPKNRIDFKKVFQQLPHLHEDQIWTMAASLREHNPMLGMRASRYGLIHPGVYDMQIRAIVRAAYSVAKGGNNIKPGIMFPLVFLEAELSELRQRVTKIEEEVREKMGIPVEDRIHIAVGSMIELPAATLAADQLARMCEFFAFGTNDLTQTALGMSRDDSAHYLPAYIEKGLIPVDPFKVLCDPVRELVNTAVRRGRRVRPDASFGICGEQGGDPKTLNFCLENELNYVSCSPFRVLPVQISLLHAALGESGKFSTSYKGENDPSQEFSKVG